MAAMASSASSQLTLAATAQKSRSASFGRHSLRTRRIEKPREQVAAVCYRIQDGLLEFMLVRTRRGRRWIFPKGGVEPRLTRSQSAALEALEEAGVHGSIEEAPFAEYVSIDRIDGANLSGGKQTIAAYLCAVSWLTAPHEANRHPTWFSPEKAKKKLGQYRERRFAQELCRVVDRAVARVERLQSRDFMTDEPLRRTHFEAPPSLGRFGGKVLGGLSRANVSRVVDRRMLQLGPAPGLDRERLQVRLLEAPRELAKPFTKRTKQPRSSLR